MDTDDSPPSILIKAFALLRVFTPERRVMSLSEIGRASGLPKSTVHRLLARLIDLGAIEQHRSGYRIGALLLQLAATAPAVGMRDIASPHLSALHHRTGLTVRLGVLRKFDVVVLDKHSRRTTSTSPGGIGSRMPANCSALGKALLAHEDLEDLEMFLPTPMPGMTSASITDPAVLIRQLRVIHDGGVARDHQECQAGIAGMATTMFVMGSAVAAIAVSMPAAAPPVAPLETMLRDTAARVATDVYAALADGRINWFPNEIDESERVN